MTPTKGSDALRSRCSAITDVTDDFCRQRLTEEYLVLARRLVKRLRAKSPTLLLRGDLRITACAVVYALGFVNFLFDPDSEPHMTAAELCAAFEVGQSGAYNKSLAIRESLSLIQFHPDWCLPSLVDDNPLVWTLEINGIAVDVRFASPEVQKVAYEKRLIPYIPKAPASASSEEQVAPDQNEVGPTQPTRGAGPRRRRRAETDDPTQGSLGLAEDEPPARKR